MTGSQVFSTATWLLRIGMPVLTSLLLPLIQALSWAFCVSLPFTLPVLGRNGLWQFDDAAPRLRLAGLVGSTLADSDLLPTPRARGPPSPTRMP